VGIKEISVEHNTRRRLDLAGQWDIAFDESGAGLGAGWATGAWPAALAEAIQVPALWTVTHPDKIGIAFYHKTFDVAMDWGGQVVNLCIGGASYRLDAWVNGQYAGSHEGAYTPFSFDISRLVRVGAANELVLRVASLSKTEAIDGLILQQCPASKQSWYYIEAGLWGDVYVEAAPLVSCRSLAIEPDLCGQRVLFEVEISNAAGRCCPAELRMQITGPQGDTVAELVSPVAALPGLTHHTFRIAIARPVQWTPDNPALYHAQVTLRPDVGEGDSVRAAFGMRDFTVKDGQFFLNGQPIYLRGILLQPNFPVTLICPPDPAMMRTEISLAKQAGFNMIRTHIRPSPPGYLDLCDEMGMMVYAESSLAWIKDSRRLVEHGRREIEAMIRRDRNHPSVVIWGVLNENRPATALAADALTRFVRSLDPTRVVVDNSGGSLALDQDFGWVDRATAIPNRETERQRIMDIHIYIGAPTPDLAYEWLRTLGAGEPTVDMPGLGIGVAAVLEEFYRELRSYGGKIFVSELGCGGMSDLRDTVARFGGHDGVDARELRLFRDGLESGFKERRLENVFGSLDHLFAAAQEQQAIGNIRQIEAVLANPRSSGYCVTQLNDIGWEFHAGILDVWRRPKRVYEALKRVNRPHCVILKAASSVATCGQQIPVAVAVVDSVPLAAAGAGLVIVARQGDVAQAPIHIRVPAGVGIKELGTVMIDVGDLPGPVGIEAHLYDGEKNLLAESRETIPALPAVDAGVACEQVRWVGAPPAGVSSATANSDRQLLGVARPSALADHDWDDFLSAVAAGAVAILGPIQPTDQTAIAACARHGVQVQVHMGIGSWMGCYHWIPESPLFSGLPAGGLAGEVYTSVLARHVLSEQGGDILAGSLYNSNTRFESPAILWFSDVEAIAHGKGTLLFCQYRVFDQQGSNPLAARLLANLVQVAQGYVERRA
jgi:beta-galactosidase